jgi:hypothetical protein
MSLEPRISRRKIGLSSKINPIAEIGRRNDVFSSQQSGIKELCLIHLVRLSLPYLSFTGWHLVVDLVELEMIIHINLEPRQ